MALQLGCHADAGVFDGQAGLIGFAAKRDRDSAAGLGILGRVVEQVRDDLFQTGRVAVDPERLGTETGREFVPERFDQGKRCLDGVVDDRVEVDGILAKLDLSARDPRDIKKIFEQSRHMVDLAPCDIERFFDQGVPPHLQANDLQGIRQRRQRVAQLVGQHRQKLILALTGLLKLFGLAPEAASPFAFDR